MWERKSSPTSLPDSLSELDLDPVVQSIGSLALITFIASRKQFLRQFYYGK